MSVKQEELLSQLEAELIKLGESPMEIAKEKLKIYAADKEEMAIYQCKYFIYLDKLAKKYNIDTNKYITEL